MIMKLFKRNRSVSNVPARSPELYPFILMRHGEYLEDRERFPDSDDTGDLAAADELVRVEVRTLLETHPADSIVITSTNKFRTLRTASIVQDYCSSVDVRAERLAALDGHTVEQARILGGMMLEYCSPEVPLIYVGHTYTTDYLPLHLQRLFGQSEDFGEKYADWHYELVDPHAFIGRRR